MGRVYSGTVDEPARSYRQGTHDADTGLAANTPMKTRFVIAFLALLSLAAPLRGVAHGDNDDPLYVADHGTDAGDCLDNSAPCQTISYALSRAGKGGQILVAPGTYELSVAEDVFHLIGGVVDVSGGQLFGDNPTSQRGAASTLTGVASQFRDILEEKGFQVIADQKNVSRSEIAKADQLLEIHQRLKSSISATPCTGGSAAGLPCADVDLLSHVGFVDISASPFEGNDIWGFVDLNSGREYAIAGFNIGTGVFDVTDPNNPR